MDEDWEAMRLDSERRINDLNQRGIIESRPRTNWIGELAKLEKKRIHLHDYITMKLEEHDYHAIADAAMDLRELDSRSKAIKEWVDNL